MVQNEHGVDKIESAADITLTIGLPVNEGNDEANEVLIDIPISSIDRTKEIDISEIRESSLEANGYSVNSISYSGSFSFAGSKIRHDNTGETREIRDVLYDDDGVPRPCRIDIQKDSAAKNERLEDVMVTSDSYEVSSEEETETSFDFVAMGHEKVDDTGT